MQMQTYSAVLRVGGAVSTELFLRDLTAAEAVVLRHIHGGDALTRVSRGKKVSVDNAAERERLDKKYKAKVTAEVFGPAKFAPLPATLPDLDQMAEQAIVAPAVFDLEAERARLRAEVEAELRAELRAEVEQEVLDQLADPIASPEELDDLDPGAAHEPLPPIELDDDGDIPADAVVVQPKGKGKKAEPKPDPNSVDHLL